MEMSDFWQHKKYTRPEIYVVTFVYNITTKNAIVLDNRKPSL